MKLFSHKLPTFVNDNYNEEGYPLCQELKNQHKMWKCPYSAGLYQFQLTRQLNTQRLESQIKFRFKSSKIDLVV